MDNGQTFRRALAQLMHDCRPDFWVTLALNQPHSLDRAARKLEHLQAKIDRALLGPQWQKRGRLRTQYIAVAEHEHSNLHFHAVFSVPCRKEAFEETAMRAWKALAPAGSLDIQPYKSIGAASYSAKAIRSSKSHLIFPSPNASRQPK